MKSIFVIITICFGISLYFAQEEQLTSPKLVGTWSGGDDFDEFIWHRTEALGFYLKQDPDGKIVVRLCSKSDFPLALVSTNGFAYSFPNTLSTQEIPISKAYFSTYSQCTPRTEQYWFVPTGMNIKYDKIVPLGRVKVNRFIEDYYEKPTSQDAENEFLQNMRSFIRVLRDDPIAKGFVISNIGTLNVKLRKALRLIRAARIDRKRYQVVGKRRYSTVYPELISISVEVSKSSLNEAGFH